LLGLVKMVYYVQQSVLFFRIEYYLKLGSFKAWRKLCSWRNAQISGIQSNR
jgi:hypothetical protein